MNDTVMIIIADNLKPFDLAINYYKNILNKNLSNRILKIIICSSDCLENKKYCLENGVRTDDIITTFNTSLKSYNPIIVDDNIYNSIAFCKKILDKEYRYFDKPYPKLIMCVSRKDLKRTELISKMIYYDSTSINYLYNNELMTEDDLKNEDYMIRKFFNHFQSKIN